MIDILVRFVHLIYVNISGTFASYLGVPPPNASEPIIFLAFVLAYIFLVVVLVRLVISVVRWFYRI